MESKDLEPPKTGEASPLEGLDLDLVLSADKEESEYAGPQYTCAECGNDDRGHIKWSRCNGYFEPEEWEPECMDCGSGDIEESPQEALGRAILERDELRDKVAELKAKYEPKAAP